MRMQELAVAMNGEAVYRSMIAAFIDYELEQHNKQQPLTAAKG